MNKFLPFTILVLISIGLMACGTDATETAEKCTEISLQGVCPLGSLPQLDAAATSACDGRIDGSYIEQNGSVSGQCQATGECRVLCQLQSPCNGTIEISRAADGSESYKCIQNTVSECAPNIDKQCLTETTRRVCNAQGQWEEQNCPGVSICKLSSSECSTCGNGQVDLTDGEECDGGDLNNQECADRGFDSGNLGCTNACRFDTSNCQSAACGNGSIDGNESCDGNQVGNNTCQSQNFEGGTIACTSNCQLDTNACFKCGDNKKNGTEQCDGPDVGSMTCAGLNQGFSGSNQVGCTNACAYDTTNCSKCGNGQIDAGEQCDGANIDNQNCSLLGLGNGNITCKTDCRFDTSSCTQPPPDPPAGWTCSPTYYDAADGCDCGCGVLDPDCSSANRSACGFCVECGSSCDIFVNSTQNWLCAEPPASTRQVFSSIAFRYIPAGTFTMGSPTNELGRDTGEIQHQVTLTKGFWMKETEVTQSEWIAVMGSNPSEFFACGGNCPVEKVSWFDAINFCNALSLSQGLSVCYTAAGASQINECTGYRLPTEAEWEYAARAETTTAFYNGSIATGTNVAGCVNDSNASLIGWYCITDGNGTHPVAQKNHNAWYLYDMSGNVGEWVWDYRGTYSSGSVTNPEGPSTGTLRTQRGGSWDVRAIFLRSASRYTNGHSPSTKGYGIGFRIVKNIP